MLLLLMSIVLIGHSSQAAAPAIGACTPQPMPPAIDSVGDLPIASETIEFSATPSLDYPGRSWVVRVSRRGQIGATIEIIRLVHQRHCNRYDVEARWQAPLKQSEYLDAANRVIPFGVPSSSAFVPSSVPRLDDLVLDGTSIKVRLRSQGWRVDRDLNHYGRGGAEISAVFRDLVARHVPAEELPEEDWRTPSKPQ